MWDNPGGELDPAEGVRTPQALQEEHCTNVSPSQRGGAVPDPLTRGGPKWRDNYPEVSVHPVTPNRLEFYSMPFATEIFSIKFLFWPKERHA